MSPAVTTWARLEGSAHDHASAAGLSARLADPLWLLARQWQAGELDGTDGGRLVAARLRGRNDRLRVWRPGDDGDAHAFDPRRDALEALVERDPGSAPGAFLAAAAGRRLLQLLAAAKLSQHAEAFRAAWPLPGTADPGDATAARLLGATGGRLLDGARAAGRLRDALGPEGDGKWPTDGPDVGADEGPVRDVVLAWLAWWEARIAPPATASAWIPRRQRYALGAATAGSDPVVLRAGDHRGGGALDWHAFTSVPKAELIPADAVSEATRDLDVRLLPAPVTFRGAPAARWWEIEDGDVALARVDAAADETPKLLFLEFALVYGNDWFLIPLRLPAASWTRIDSLVVTDSFGVRTLVPGADEIDAAGPWRLWAIAHEAPDGSPGSEGHAGGRLLAAAGAGALAGPPVEEVAYLRDEMNAMAWAVERRVPGPLGRGSDRARAEATQTAPARPPDPDAIPVYAVTRPTPAWWYPLPPAQAGLRAIEFTLGRVAGAAGSQPAPSGRILADTGAPAGPLTLAEETVPRAGLRVVARARYLRTPDGGRRVWVGRSSGPGGGEGSSGLRYDDVTLPGS